jgi:hypothetical protein
MGSICSTSFATSCPVRAVILGVQQAQVGHEVLLIITRQDAVRWRRDCNERIERRRLHLRRIHRGRWVFMSRKRSRVQARARDGLPTELAGASFRSITRRPRSDSTNRMPDV